MKKGLLKIAALIVVGIFLLVPNSAFSKDGDYYFTAGMAYHAEEFNADLDYDNTYGLNIGLGYDAGDSLSIELQMDKIMEFGTKNSISKNDVDLRGYSLNLKYYPAGSAGKVNGYLLTGLGWMKAELTDGNIMKEDTSKTSDYFGKFGVGSDFTATDKISFYMEADYVSAFGDLNPIDYYSAKIGFMLYL